MIDGYNYLVWLFQQVNTLNPSLPPLEKVEWGI